MRLLQLTLLALMAACSGLPAGAAEKVASFSSLTKGDELHVTFTTTGCFHYAIYELTFRRSDEMIVKIIQKRQMNAPGGSPDSKTPVELGGLKLTKADLEGLDHLVEFYRSGPKNTCTTVDEMSISQHRDGKPIATEKFKDGSCAHDKKELTRITELVDRLSTRK